MNSRVLRLQRGETGWRKLRLKNRKQILKTVDGGNWVTKFTAKKIENVGSTFSVKIFITPPLTHSPAHRNHRMTLDEWWKLCQKIQNSGLISSAAIFAPSPNHNHCRTLEFAILNLHQTFLGIYSSQYRIWEFCDYDWRGGGVMKIAAEKLESSAWHWKDHLLCGWDKSSSQIDRHQAARRSRFPNLARWLAVWMRL